MENTNHVLLAGAGAEQFADTVNVERCENSYFYTDLRSTLLGWDSKPAQRHWCCLFFDWRFRSLQQAKQADTVQLDHAGITDMDIKQDKTILDPDEAAHVKGTVGCVALDVHGNLAGRTLLLHSLLYIIDSHD